MKEYINNRIRCFNPSSDQKNSEIKKRIYHYTSPYGLYGILGNSTIRFTDCQFLNDKSEYTHILEPLNKALKEIKKDLRNDFGTIIQNMIRENFECEDIKVIEESNKLYFNITQKRYYVFCTSTMKDSLGMWNYYVKGGNYQGYNIGFRVSQLLDCFSSIDDADIDVFYGEVLYSEKEQIKILKDLLLKADEELEDKLRQVIKEEDIEICSQEIKGEVINYLENYRLFFKNEAFINEKEYRFILKLPLQYTPLQKDPIRTGFDVKNGVIIPFCELTIDKDKTIDSILLSPMLESELAKQGLNRYLKYKGYNSKIDIFQSKVPIRY